jgi:hypothetical protein
VCARAHVCVCVCVCVCVLTLVLVILQIAVNQKRVWDDYEEAYASAVRAGGRKAGPEIISMMQVSFTSIVGLFYLYSRSLLLIVTYIGPEIIPMMQIPEEVMAVEGTVTSEYTKSRRVREAEFLRFRQRFLQDADCPVQIPTVCARVGGGKHTHTHKHTHDFFVFDVPDDGSARAVCLSVCVSAQHTHTHTHIHTHTHTHTHTGLLILDVPDDDVRARAV